MESSELYCDICDVQTSSVQQMSSHKTGQRHWFNKRQLEEANRSVYVKGFLSSDSIEEELKRVFERFSEVHKITAVAGTDKKPAFAIVEFSCAKGALEALQYNGDLLLHDQLLKVKPREVKLKHREPGKFKPRSQEESEATSSDSSSRHNSFDEGSLNASVATENNTASLTWDQVLSQAQLHVPAEDKRRLQELTSIDDQMELLATLYKLPPESLQLRLDIIAMLEAKFQLVYPSCRVIPFGSMVTGLATPTSDLDLVLLTNFTAADENFFGSPNYLQVQMGEVSTGGPAYPSSDSMADEMDTSSETSFSSSSSLTTPPPSVMMGRPGDHAPAEFQKVLSVISGIPDCVKVLGLPSARCPIIRFIHEPTGVHCDISVNNRLGPHNTRLLKAYLEFDRRVIPLLLVLRLWARVSSKHGISRTQLNNYALSLLLIGALQRCTPPVLPSLQAPAGWPTNMEWYSARGFSHHGEAANQLIISGWRAGFCDPASLLPSTNKASFSELLCHFFQYYSEFNFSANAVTIHTPISNQVTVHEASSSAEELAKRSSEIPQRMKALRVGIMCVQDPFELTHNVTKSINHKSFASLVQRLRVVKHSMEQCLVPQSSTPTASLNLLQILTITGDPPSLQKTLKLENNLHFADKSLRNFFQKVEELVPLAQVIDQLSSRKEMSHKLGLVILKALVVILQRKVGVECQPVQAFLPVSLPDVIDSQSQLSTTGTCNKSVGSGRKRHRDALDGDDIHLTEEEAVTSSDEAKRIKMLSSAEATPESVLENVIRKEPLASAYDCFAYTNTWIHRRKQLRYLKQARAQDTGSLQSRAQDTGSLQSMAQDTGSLQSRAQDTGSLQSWAQDTGSLQAKVQDTASSSPLTDFALPLPPTLCFRLSIAPPLTPASTNIKLEVLKPEYADQFSTFFAFFKKIVFCKN